MKLGKRELDGLSCPPGRQDLIVFDDALTGFAVRVSSKGTKTFIFQYRRGSAVRRVRLGELGDVTPAQARRHAEALRGQVAAGLDPAADRKAAIAAEEAAAQAKRVARTASAFTFGRLVEAWQAEGLRDRRPRYRDEATRALRWSFRTLMETAASAVDAPTVRRALAAISAPTGTNVPPDGAKKREKGPLPADGARRGETMARRARAYGSAMYGWALKRDLVMSNPFSMVAVDSREKRRDRVLSDTELGEIWRATGGLGWPWGPYTRFLLLTLQRQAETAGIEWSELSPDRVTWQLPGTRTKNGKGHLVHLAAPAREIVRAAPRMDGSPFLFTTTGDRPVCAFSYAKRRLDEAIAAARSETAAAAGSAPEPFSPWRLHDFRRTGVTALAGLGVRWEVADRLLNHSSGAIGGVAAIYQRHEFLEERKAALELWAAHLLRVSV